MGSKEANSKGAVWPRAYKKFQLDSAEHEILNAGKYKISRNSAFLSLR